MEEVALYPDDRITFRALEGLSSASSVPGSQAATQGFTFICAGYDFLSAKNIDFQKLKNHTFMVRIQAFMDAYYMDIKTLMKCCVGELFLGVRMIPFCAYNRVGYREQIRAKRTLSKTAR